MSLYTIKVLKDDRAVRQWTIKCEAGSDSRHVVPNDEGVEEPVTWTEAEANGELEDELAALLDSYEGRFSPQCGSDDGFDDVLAELQEQGLGVLEAVEEAMRRCCVGVGYS
jgi:hypothetical protein